MKIQCFLVIIICLFVLNCGLSGGGPGDKDYPGTWKGEDIWVENVGWCDIEVILTKTDYRIYLYLAGTGTLLIGSNYGTHTGLIEASESADLWNTLTVTHQYDGFDWNEVAVVDEDFASFWIEKSTMHFKYDVDADHVTAIDAEGDLIWQ